MILEYVANFLNNNPKFSKTSVETPICEYEIQKL